LAEDLDRFQTGKAIEARPTPAWERVIKWAKRRPTVASLTVLTGLVTAVGFGLVTWQWLRAERALDSADQSSRAASAKALAEAKARSNAEKAQQAEAKAKNELQLALVRVEKSLYSRLMALTQREWLDNHLDLANYYLDQCQPDLRQWDWHY